MRQQVTVKYVNPAKEGKKYGSIKGSDDQTYWVKADMVAQFSKGQAYELEVGQEKWGDNQVNVVKALPGASQGSVAPANGGHSNSDRWYMPFVSNTVAHAIAAGKIAEPDDIKMWAAAAKEAAEAL